MLTSLKALLLALCYSLYIHSAWLTPSYPIAFSTTHMTTPSCFNLFQYFLYHPKPHSKCLSDTYFLLKVSLVIQKNYVQDQTTHFIGPKNFPLLVHTPYPLTSPTIHPVENVCSPDFLFDSCLLYPTPFLLHCQIILLLLVHQKS